MVSIFPQKVRKIDANPYTFPTTSDGFRISRKRENQGKVISEHSDLFRRIMHRQQTQHSLELLIPPGTQQAGTVYTIGESEGRHAPFRIETQALPGSGKTNISGTPGSKMKESFETACDYLQANMRELSRDETLDDYNINVQVLNPADANEGGETSVGLLVGIVSGILDRPVRPQTVVLGAMSLMGELVAVSSLVDKLQLAADSGARTVLLPAKNKEGLAKIPDELLDQLQLVFYTDPLEAASKAIELD